MSYQSMMQMPLTTGSLIDHAARAHAATEIVSVEANGDIIRTTWGEVARNSKRLHQALDRLGVSPGARCATVAWNNHRHLECYFGIGGGGRVVHTVNPRLVPQQVAYVVGNAGSEVVFFDKTFLPLIAALHDKMPSVRAFVYLGAADDEISAAVPDAVFYDEMISREDGVVTWSVEDENLPAALCYTSGTTGMPKGVEYTHRSIVLHSLAGNQPDCLNIGARDTVLPVVPMFHVNAWGVPYIAAGVGARVVMPGPRMDGESLARLIDSERVTLALGVPTIWMGLLEGLASTGLKVEALKRTVVGGTALPPSMIAAFRDLYGVDLIHAWGMTETSPLGTINQLLAKHVDLSTEEKERLRQGQGRPPYGVDLRLVDDQGHVLPRDGKTEGRLQVRGHWVVNQYFGQEKSALTMDDWFDTGDIATLDEDMYMIIRDRAKDIIKSGGEWISTVELENIAIAHPRIANAAVIAARHPKWDERPVVIAIPAIGGGPTEEELLATFKGKIADWQIPDRVVFVDKLPLGATGKVQKVELRKEYGNILIDG